MEGGGPKKSLRLSVVVEDLIMNLIPSMSGVNVDEAADLSQSSLWSVDLNWSEQAKALRMLAIQNPQAFTMDYARKSISQLRIVGREVTCVDEGTLLFSKLEELVLTGNFITHLLTAHIPSGVKVLELCYNMLCDLPCAEGCILSNLEHLGLAYNYLSQLKLTISQWPRLLSLDLSHNCLCDLETTVLALQSLTSLRSLMLTGNPLAFVLYYKKYVVDGLQQLICLDGKDISSNMREEASGSVSLCRHQPALISTCKLNFTVSKLTNLPRLQCEENIDQEGIIVQHMLIIGYEFLHREEHTPVLSNSGKEILMHVSRDINTTTQPNVFFEPTKYQADSTVCSWTSIMHSYTITDLGCLVKLVAKGIGVSVSVTKLVYSKADQLKQDSPVAHKRLISGKGTKSGRASIQSGVSSVAKKPVVATTKAGAGKANQDLEKKLQEGWKIVNATSYKLGAKLFDVSTLLEDERALTVSNSLDLSDGERNVLAQSGLFNTTSEGCDGLVLNVSEILLGITVNIE